MRQGSHKASNLLPNPSREICLKDLKVLSSTEGSSPLRNCSSQEDKEYSTEHKTLSNKPHPKHGYYPSNVRIRGRLTLQLRIIMVKM